MRIRGLSVQGLFGIFDHEVPMNMEDRVTIIHSPNGYGKTTILRMVNGLFNRRYPDLRSIPFREFRVELDDRRSLAVTKSGTQNSRGVQEGSRRRGDGELVVKLLRGNKEIEKLTLAPPSPEEWQASVHIFEQMIPGLVREGRTTWRFLPTGEHLAFEELVERFPDLVPSRAVKPPRNGEWLQEIQKSVQVRFIESQRLLRLGKLRRTREYDASSASWEPSVAMYSEELAKSIQAMLAEYAALSQSLDRTFPVRLVEQMQSRKEQQHLAVGELRGKLNQLEEKRARLREAGLLGKEEDVRFLPQELQEETTQRVLPVYVEDVEKKLSVFDDIAAKIDVLQQIVTTWFTFKSMSIDREKGFVFTSQEGQPLLPTHLSSGEQHTLVLFSELLFRTERNALVMIDEPEISLHVTWQQQFLRDLQRVTELASFDVLIATHSPQMINDRWDLTVELRNPVEQPV